MSDIIVGSVGVQLVPSAKGFPEKVKALLHDLTVDVRINLDDALAAARLDELTRARDVTINADADTAAAEARLDLLARPRKAVIDAQAGGLAGASSDANSTAGFMGVIAGAVAVLGPALVPVGAAFAGIAADAGLTAVAVKKTEDTQKKINALLHTAATTSSKKTYESSVAQAKALQATLGGPQQALLAAQGGLGKAFQGLLTRVGPALFRPLIVGLNLLTQILGQAGPLIRATSGLLTGLIRSMSADVANGGFAKFISYVITTLPPVFQLLGSLGSLLSQLFVGLAPAGSALLGILSNIFGLLASIPAGVLAPLTAGLIGLIGGPWVAAFAGLAVVLETLYTKSDAFRSAISSLAGVVQTNLAPVFAQLVATWQQQLLPALRQSGPVLLDTIGKWITLASGIAGNVLPILIKVAGIVLGVLLPAMMRLQGFIATAMIFAFNQLGRVVWQIAGIIGKAQGFILNALGHVLNGIGNLLDALSHVPSFGWAKDAANAMHGAGNAALSLGDAISSIPSWKDITVAIHVHQTTEIDDAYRGPKSGGTKPTIGKPKHTKHPLVPATPLSIPSFSGGGGGGSKHGGGGPSAAQRARTEMRKLLNALTSALRVGNKQVEAALANIVSHITDFPKKFRGPLRDVAGQFKTLMTRLDGFKSQMKDLAKSISSAFMPQNLFGGTLSQLGRGLSSALTNVQNALTAQKLLAAAGVPAAFVSALLASGNGSLAAQLAANPSLASGFAAQYAQVGSLANQLGSAAAGAQFNPQIDKTNHQLDALNKKVEHLAAQIGHAVGHEINGSAKTAKSRGRRTP